MCDAATVTNNAAAVNESATVPEQRFLQWLLDNGASFPKIAWPRTTPNGLRGATSIETIATGEMMIQIPQRLIISEQLCWEDEQLRPKYEANRDVFTRDDPVMAFFLVREMIAGDKSFFYPYLSMLPYPESVQDWNDDELAELRDSVLATAAKRRTADIQTFYKRIFTRFDEKYPGEFPREQYTFDRFAFAWKTIQARTFGRRLPWTALVPFADCLNHSNVATKYDFNVDNNGMFRLFPCANTSFPAGTEVFNSYGRRPNFQLLLDYGFALADNEWDYVDVMLPKDKIGTDRQQLPFMRRIRLDRKSTLEELLPSTVVVALGDLSPPVSPRAGDSDKQNKDEEEREQFARVRGLEWLQEILSKMLLDFDTSIEEDEKRLESKLLPEHLRMAVIYRLSRMKILEDVIRHIKDELGSIHVAGHKEREQIDTSYDDDALTDSMVSKLNSVHFEQNDG